MALINCPHCGKPISDKAEKCIHCGIVLGKTNNDITPLKTTELATNGYGKLTFEWKGLWMAANTDIYITLNGQGVGNQKSYSLKDGFYFETPITSDYANIGIKLGQFFKYDKECHFEKGMNYTCTFSYSRWTGALTYVVTDENGNVISRKGYSIGRIIINILGAIVLIGSLFYWCNYAIEIITGDANSAEQVDVSVNENQEKPLEEDCAVRIIGTYKFSDKYELNNWNLVINKDGTCSLFEERNPKGIWRGVWEYLKYSNYFSLTWSSCDNPYENNLPFTSKINYIDGESRYIYASNDAMKAKDPNARYELLNVASGEANLNDTKTFTSMDLSALMLHGKVKRVTESYRERGANNTIFDFNEQGKLIRVNDTSCRTSTVNDKYTIWYEDVKQVYTFDSKGRIIRLDEDFDENCGASIEYSEYNERGWPTKKVDLSASWVKIQLIYSVIDYYGNWTQCESVTENDTLTIYREIEYYPIGQ